MHLLCFCVKLNCFWFESTSGRTNHFCCWELRNPGFLRTDTGIQPLTTMSLLVLEAILEGWYLQQHMHARLICCSIHVSRILALSLGGFLFCLCPERGTQAFSSKGRFFKVLFLENVVSINQIPIQNSMVTQRIMNTLLWGHSWTSSLAYPQNNTFFIIQSFESVYKINPKRNIRNKKYAFWRHNVFYIFYKWPTS